ncbi:MAG: transporter substrate-binding domain-containing protein [Succinivibrio sp.]|uniref:amino acid ABC transporter substrate-binding protein n=1 Tax=Succinivibrio sp. TaxID=2053619 RepID=UPI002F94DCB3|nr:transporter substrate-binding domain-containing protein [Succinatimonas hippei]
MLKYINAFSLFMILVIVAIYGYTKVFKDTKTVYVGIDGYLPPFSSTNSYGESQGYSVDIIRQLTDTLDMNIKFRIVPFSSLNDCIKNRTVDIVIAPFDTSKEKKETYSEYTLPYYVNYPTLAVRKNRNMTDFNKYNMKGKTICVLNKSDILNLIRLNFYYSKIAVYTNSQDAFEDLIHGKCDAIADSKSSNSYHVTKHKLRRIAIKRILPNIKGQEYRIAVRKGENDLLNKINYGLFYLNSTGVIDQISKKWFGSGAEVDITQSDVANTKQESKKYLSFL